MKMQLENFIKAKMKQALVRWNRAQEMYEVGQMQSAANMYASAMRLYYECATDLIDGEGFVREVSQMEASNIKAMRDACGTCYAKREVAELRECLKETMVDAVAEYKNNSCFRNVKCGEIERCGTCKVMKWRKALRENERLAYEREAKDGK